MFWGEAMVAAGCGAVLSLVVTTGATGPWVSRDARFHVRGEWNWALQRELPELYREFNGIDFGHAHLAEALLRTQAPHAIEAARLQVLEFIFSKPAVPPDEDQLGPEFTRLVWEVRRTFDWTHIFHRSLYDLFSSDAVQDKPLAYRRILRDYLEKPEAITPHHLDHHGKLWSWPESRSFRDRHRAFNSQIWAYHWLQAAAYDVQLMGDANQQRQRMPAIIEHYHGYLNNPPLHWQTMPMMAEGAPQFTGQFPEAAAIFDNLHMLHDNIDDILARPDLYPTSQARRGAMLRVLDIYLHRNHDPVERYDEYHTSAGDVGRDHGPGPGHDATEHEMVDHDRPPAAGDVVERQSQGQARPPRSGDSQPAPTPRGPEHPH